ncbi:LysR substrate-binding domain-containing protein [Polaromonas sp. JS666]|uniref:LysR substrate-binding domain-containing protein n=1 Tax=Polaromonas sp. (strain JS666 / ATCC BAA-500) TaxID=296591 RepID=UPI000046451C|nr:LysR substrate-binding domain-containing protein [Polaromonas sp. JS666]ABE43973.1 transcriptional regulator, LysR family [Polaromonas sp. JS666]
MNTLDLELLRALVAIEEQDSFAGAAIHLGKTQSAVTQQMQRLEDQIGHPLFEKQGRHKRLTPHGQKLLDYARHLLAINDDALRSLQQGNLEGVLRIGAPHDVADTMLPTLLAQVARASPLLRLDIHVGRSPFLMESLKRGEIDMTISNRNDPALDGVVLRTSPTVWLCSASYVHDRAKPVPLILVDGPSVFYRLAREALDAAGIRWSPNYTASSLIGIKAALRAGLGVTARGIEMAGADLRVLGENDGLPRLPDLDYYLFVRKNVINPITRKVFDMLKANLGLIRSAAEPVAPQRLLAADE